MNLKPRPTEYDRFTVARTIEGYEVTDSDGRSVSPSFTEQVIAYQVRDSLNVAAASGPGVLLKALGEVELEEELVYA